MDFGAVCVCVCAFVCVCPCVTERVCVGERERVCVCARGESRLFVAKLDLKYALWKVVHAWWMNGRHIQCRCSG